MGWLQKNVGSHVSGAAKFLGKNISNGSSWFHKMNKVIGSVKDKYASAKNSLIQGISNYNPEMGKLASSGINLLENQVQSTAQPYIDKVKNMGGMAGRALLDFQNE